MAPKTYSRKPGVYKLQTASGKTNYIGKVKANRLDKRISEHKAEERIPFAKVEFTPAKTNARAKAIERAKIRQAKPLYNRVLKRRPL